jgi:hypothetical protein
MRPDAFGCVGASIYMRHDVRDERRNINTFASRRKQRVSRYIMLRRDEQVHYCHDGMYDVFPRFYVS